MKKYLCILVSFLFFSVFISCTENKKNIKTVEAKNIQVKKENKENEEVLMLVDKVLKNMSERAQTEIVIQDKKTFLKELALLLKEEETFTKDDISLFYLIDKTHTVSSDYVPKNLIPVRKNELYSVSRNDLSLRLEADKALKIMAQAALNDGVRLLVSSTYRSYEYQKNLFDYWVKVDGLKEAERESARPGTSQHQLGVAVDFGSITDDFADTKMGKWMYENAANYGWSLSFPKQYEDITGYRWESWHFRYIGKTACAMQKKWFCNVQQYMLEFINLWKQENCDLSDFLVSDSY